MNKKKIGISEAKSKAEKYCAYQERSHKEVENKLKTLGLNETEIGEALVHLVNRGFLNEERFAKAFVGGKFRMKNWGRIKIVNALEAKGLTKNCIRIGLQEIDDADYLRTIELLIYKKLDQTEEGNIYVKREKLATHVIQKGFEPELVWEILKKLIK